MESTGKQLFHRYFWWIILVMSIIVALVYTSITPSARGNFWSILGIMALPNLIALVFSSRYSLYAYFESGEVQTTQFHYWYLLLFLGAGILFILFADI